MANWALVENNEIKELHDLLPKNWKFVSGLNLSFDNLQFLNNLGWYKVVKETNNFDDSNFTINGYDYTFSNNSVLETPILVPIVQNTQSLQELKHIFLTQLREKRNEILSQSDWTQLSDVQNIMSESEKYKWAAYRQALRNLPENYATNETINLNGVSWPDINLFAADIANTSNTEITP